MITVEQSETLIAIMPDVLKYYRDIRRRGKVRDKRQCVRVALSFVESDAFIAMIKTGLPSDEPDSDEVKALFAGMVAEYEHQRDEGYYDDLDDNFNRLQDCLDPFYDLQFEARQREARQELAAAETSEQIAAASEKLQSVIEGHKILKSRRTQ